MECTNINQVINTLDTIIEDCKTTNCPLGYFAVLYKSVTLEVKEGILNQRFDDNPRMEKLDVLFANRYFTAYFDYKNQKNISKSWKVAFEAQHKNSYIVLQHLLLGINAHINLDLGIVANQTVGQFPLEGIQNDFNHINQLLAYMTDQVKKNMSSVSPVFGWLMPLAKRWDDKVIQFSITTARDGAWQFAKCLNQDVKNSTTLISERDQVIAKLGTNLISPVRTLQWILSTIGFFESKSVREKMKILEQKITTL